MSSLGSPWFHQRTTAAPAPPAPDSVRQQSAMVRTAGEIRQMTARLVRPTVASNVRKSLHWKQDSCVDQGRQSWTKMSLFKDTKDCMWTNNGTVKSSCKI